MKNTLLLLFMFLFIPHSRAAGLEHAVGIGLQYGGIIGYQLSSSTDQGRIRGAVGVIGVSVGYDHKMSDTFSIGATVTATLRTVYSLNLNYMPKGQDNSGWMFALDLGYMPDKDGKGWFDNYESQNVLWLSTGYRF